MTVDPSICAAQLTEEDCQAAGCNAWLAYYELTVTLDQCESQVVGPLCMNYTEPGGPTAWGAFARLFEADVPEVLGRGNLAVPDGWVRCGEPGSEGLRACCCYTNPFPDDTCAGVQSDLP